MKSIEQLYNIARKTYVFRLSVYTIIPYAAIMFLFVYFVLNDSSNALSSLFRAFILSVASAIFTSYIIIFTIFRKQRVLKYYNILHSKFPNVDKSLLLLISFYLIQHKKVYSLVKKHYFNKQLKQMGKSFGIKYYEEKDEDEVQNILIFAKNTNFNINND